METKNVVRLSEKWPFTELEVDCKMVDKYGLSSLEGLEMKLRDTVKDFFENHRNNLSDAERLRFDMAEYGHELKDIDFSDHASVNIFFGNFPVSGYDRDKFVDLIVGMEESAKEWKEINYLPVAEVIDNLGLMDEFTDEEVTNMKNFVWDKKHPFDYQINVVRPDDDGNIEYYVVFSCAPAHI